ncbi:MAG: hypothetical protein KME42_16230 [Tildeniella nuda ZEHNDER 1965/U140]|jgi:hypothetical protein|nr:hypothetical protein [Tildeniella nuda ZEHNDER 1965/U140]
MSFFNADINFDERLPEELTRGHANCAPREALQAFDFGAHLEQLAVFLAQTWKDEHPGATVHSEDDLNHCILAVTTELAIAAKAVGGPVALAILTGGGSAAARAVCKQVLANDCA